MVQLSWLARLCQSVLTFTDVSFKNVQANAKAQLNSHFSIKNLISGLHHMLISAVQWAFPVVFLLFSSRTYSQWVLHHFRTAFLLYSTFSEYLLWLTQPSTGSIFSPFIFFRFLLSYQSYLSKWNNFRKCL